MPTIAEIKAKPRIVCQFSCGAASAVSTKLTIAQYGDTHEIAIINAFIKEEHPDNRRFLADCEAWFSLPITVLRDQKYGASVREVWRRHRYIKGLKGAPCTKVLKREVLDRFRHPDDIMVMGYTSEEEDRRDRFIDANPTLKIIAPLIECGIGKADCLALIERAGIRRPAMYRLGYHNANCLGCCKGGEGYWNKVRVDFPDDFEEIATIQDGIGPGAYFFRDRKTGERYSLRQLPPDKGRYQDEPDISCSASCEFVELEFNPCHAD